MKYPRIIEDFSIKRLLVPANDNTPPPISSLALKNGAQLKKAA